MTRSDARRYLFAYDIPCDRRRSRVAKQLQEYGDRVQYSVFVIDSARVGVSALEAELQELINRDEDSVLICDLGLAAGVEASRFRYLGLSRSVTDRDSFIL